MRFKVGEQPVPGYRLDAFLGAGSYGEVWKVIGPGGVPCAMKFISLDSKSGLKEFRSIGLVKKLQHPNLCPVNAIWLRDDEGNVLSDSDQNSITIRMLGPKELIIAMGLGRKTLAQRLEETRGRGIPPHELLRYMVDAARGIDYLNSAEHDLGSGPSSVIHCDIKPANLLIVGGGVQVCDYGVIRALGPDTLRKTFAAGTPAYAPPELINNEPCPQTDQYSLAITYYELRTGQLPFDETKAIVANLTGQLDLTLIAGNDEREVLRQALALQPDRRFATCEEFVDTLRVASGITLGRPPSGVHQQPGSRQLPGGRPSSGQFQQPSAERESWPQATPFADRPTPRVTPTPLPPDSAEQTALPRTTPADPPRRAPIPDSGTLQLQPAHESQVKFVPEPPPVSRGTPRPEPPLPRASSFIDDEEHLPSRSGAFLPLAIGLVLFLGLVATGVYVLFVKDDAVTVSTTPPTEPSRTTPTTDTVPTGSKTAPTRDKTGTTPTTSTLPTGGTNTTPTGKGGTTIPMTTKDYSNELKKARAHFALAEMDAQEIQKGLNELAMIPDPEPTKADPVRDTAQKLKTWWTMAWDARDLAPIDLRTKFPLPTTRDLDAADVESLNEYRRDKLAKAIATVIPRLDVESNWKELTIACEEADQTPAVLACLAECWAEGPETARKDKTYNAVELAAALNGYPQYAAMRLKQAQGTLPPALVTALLKEVEPELPPWVNARRTDVVVKTFNEAAKSVPNADAYRLLTVAERKAGANDRFDIRYRRLVAGWDTGAPKETLRAELKKLAQDLEKTDAEHVKKLAPAAQFKFWTAFASLLLDAAEGGDRVRGYTAALNVATPGQISDIQKYVFSPITTDAYMKSMAQSPFADKAAALFRQAGLHVRRNRADWDKEGPDAMLYASGLFNRAVTLTNRPEDVSWKGISLAEAKAPALAEIAAAAKLLDAPKRTDPLVVKVFRGVAGNLQTTHATSEKATKLAAHDQFISALDTLTKTKDAADERAVLMRWATANASWLAAAEQTDLPKPTAKPADAPEAETYYWLATVEQQRAAATTALDLYKKARDAAGQPGAESWVKPATTGYGDALVAEGERQWNLGDTRAAGPHFDALAELIKPKSPVSETRKAWYEAQALFRSAAPQYLALDAIIAPRLANVPAADRDALVRLYLLRSHALLGGEVVFPPPLAGAANRVKRTGLAVTDAEKAAEESKGLAKTLTVDVRGSLGMAYFFDGLAKRNPANPKLMLDEFEKAEPVLGDAIQRAPRHQDAYTWKFGLGFCVLEKLVVNNNIADVPKLSLGFSLMLEAKADLFGARPDTARGNAARTVENNLVGWAKVLTDLPENAGKDLVNLRELVDRAGAAVTAEKEFKLTDADKELLAKITQLAKKKGTPEAMTKALERIVNRLQPPG